MADLDDFTKRYERLRQMRTEANRRNKSVLFDALRSAGITSVTATFDGEGDSGQIDTIDAYAGNDPADFPEMSIPIELVGWGQTEPRLNELPLREAVEALCYDFLAEEHDGWENNDGAYGEFQFNVAKATIELEFNGRFVDVNTETHTF